MLYDQVQIELGAIYKPVRFETNTLACATGDCTLRVPGIAIHESVRGHLWEFPLTGNYFFGRNRIRPYAGGGLVLRQDFGGKCDARTTNLATGNEIVDALGLGHDCFLLVGLLQHEPSFVMDLGLRWSHSRLKIQPEFRLYAPSAANAARSANVPPGGSTRRSTGFFTGFVFSAEGEMKKYDTADTWFVAAASAGTIICSATTTGSKGIYRRRRTAHRN